MTPLFGVITLLTVVGVVVALVLVLAIVNFNALKTLWFNARSSAGAAARRVDAGNAVNNMKQAVDDAKAEISGYVGKLNKSQGQINGLNREKAESEREVKQLTADVNARAAEPGVDPDNDGVLLDLAEQLDKAQVRLGEIVTDLESQTKLHNQVLNDVKEAMKRAAELEAKADRMGVRLDLSATRAELAQVGIDFKSSSANSSLAAAESYEKQIQAQIDTNNGAVEVAAQVNPSTGNAATADWRRKQGARGVLADLGISKKDDAAK